MGKPLHLLVPDLMYAQALQKLQLMLLPQVTSLNSLNLHESLMVGAGEESVKFMYARCNAVV